MDRTWPEDWLQRRAGIGCRICLQGRPEETKGGLRFFRGQWADAYLRRSAPQPGYSMVIWRGRHIPDLADLSPDELAGYWSDVAVAGRALHAVFEPAQLNYLIFGNNVPHLHTYVLPRYLDDNSPGMPLDPFIERPVEPADFEHQIARLREEIAAPNPSAV